MTIREQTATPLTGLALLAAKLEAHRDRLFEPWNRKKAIWPDHPEQYRYGDNGTDTITLTNKEAREVLAALPKPAPVEA